jgi:hypothetical protein
MRPKVDAAASFAAATGNPAYIAELKDGARALSECAGTKITPDRRLAHDSALPEASREIARAGHAR